MTVTQAASEVKGISFHNFAASLERLRGVDVAERFRRALPAQVRDRLEGGQLLKMGWYPFEWYAALHRTAREITGEGPELAFAIGRDGTHQDFKGIYRLLRFVLTPESLITRAPGVFGRYRRPGTLAIEAAKPHYARARIAGCVGYDASQWREIAGGCVAVLEVCGANDVKPHIIEKEPDGVAIFEAHWT